ncbi:MAG: 2-oxo acid dehydrogenase subunit E2, partial [Chloroflexota bacterium]|nr:2-oxo acid dehydrogenase subunit E2 [Chloroflexota bacterium]
WLKQDGETVRSGDLIFTVESDKATQEVEVFDNGILRIPPDAPQPGAVITVGTRLAYVLQPGEAAPFEAQGAQASAQPTPPSVASPPMQPALATRGGPLGAQLAGAPRARNSISPRARRIAQELGVDWQHLSGSGRTGRIIERDVRAAQDSQAPKVRATPVAARLAQEAGIDLNTLAAHKPGERIERQAVEAAIAARTQSVPATPAIPVGESVTPTRIRRLIAQRMVESSQTAAPVTLVTEVDATELVALRAGLKAKFESRRIIVPTYNDLLMKFTALALQEHPLLNAIWHEDEIVIPETIHIGLAVDTADGLLVPVIRAVETKSVRQLAVESHRLIEQAQTRQISPDDLQGGTFTITNLGMYGIDAFTPIINLPQCAILGVGRIVVKPAVVNDQVVPRDLMTLSLTFDHRVVDGAPAARFLDTLRAMIEAPALWLI